MFGNLPGWLISAVIAGVVGYLIWSRGTPEAVSKSSGTLPQGIAALTLPADPAKLLPRGTKDCNAGELYRKAAEHYRQNKAKYEAFNKKRTLEAAKDLDALDMIAEAKDCARMDLFKSKPTEVVNYDNAKPILPDLQTLAQVGVNVAAIYAGRGDMKKARDYMEGVLAMGRNLYDERMVFEEYRIGTDAMTNAAGMLANPTFGPDGKDAARSEELKSFVKSVGDYQSKTLMPLWQAIGGMPTAKGGGLLYAGDMIDFAKNSKEPLWQTEALLKLGRMQYMTEVRYADQRGAVHVLTDMAGKPNLPPNVKAAAVAGRDLERTKFRMYGGGS